MATHEHECFVALEHFRIPDVPEELEIEETKVIGVFKTFSGAVKANEDERERRVRTRHEEEDQDIPFESLENDIDDEYRYQIEERGLQP